MSDNSDLKAAATYAAQDVTKFADEDEESRALQQFHLEVSPEAVLILFADLEESRNGMKHSCAIRLKKEIERLEGERDQLKAECEALRKEADRYRWLRDKSESVHPFYLSTPIWFTGVRFRKEDVDNAIDAAMISVATQSTDTENVSRHEGGQT